MKLWIGGEMREYLSPSERAIEPDREHLVGFAEFEVIRREPLNSSDEVAECPDWLNWYLFRRSSNHITLHPHQQIPRAIG